MKNLTWQNPEQLFVAQELINKVKSKCCGIKAKDELLEVIKHERRVELAFEGLRLFDLYRWKELDKAVANIENERTMYGLAYEARKFNGERDYVWPLPTAELDTNKKLVQHDLWK